MNTTPWLSLLYSIIFLYFRSHWIRCGSPCQSLWLHSHLLRSLPTRWSGEVFRTGTSLHTSGNNLTKQGNLLKGIDKKTGRREDIEPIKRVFTSAGTRGRSNYISGGTRWRGLKLMDCLFWFLFSFYNLICKKNFLRGYVSQIASRVHLFQ